MKISKWILFSFSLLLLVFTIPSYRSHIFALNFVDEDDNIVIGNYVREGKKLYTDVFSQHQPSMFLASSAIQNILKPDNILMVVKRHREFMMIWSAIWVIVLVARFGFKGLFVSSVMELSKIILLGNMFLAESIIIYPLLYVILFILSGYKIRYKFEIWTLSIIFWFLVYSLTPLWPLLGLIAFLLYINSEDKMRLATAWISVGILTTLILFLRVNLYDYLLNALYINYKYYIPLTTPVGFWDSLFKAFFAPVLALSNSGSSSLLLLVKVLSLSYLINIIFFITHKSYNDLMLFILLPCLAALRYIDPSNTLYGAFHMLPWLVILACLSFPVYSKPKFINISIYILIFLASLNIARTQLFDYRDPATDFYVHYSPSVDIREAVKILSKTEHQTIWVEPVMYWPHWHTGASSYSSMVNYYGWMDQTLPMKKNLETQLAQQLPTIVYAETTLGVGKYLDSYDRFYRDGKPTNIYLRKDVAQGLTKETLKELDYYRFEIN